MRAAVKAAHSDMLAVLALADFEIVGMVVGLVAVDVMDGFGITQRTAELAGGDEAVFGDAAFRAGHAGEGIAWIDNDKHVSRSVPRACACSSRRSALLVRAFDVPFWFLHA